VNVAVVPLYVTLPATAAPPGPATVKVAALIVLGLIASLKLALSACPMGTPVTPFAGAVETISGETTAGAVPVVKVHT
jgi:hypothetical protein